MTQNKWSGYSQGDADARVAAIFKKVARARQANAVAIGSSTAVALRNTFIGKHRTVNPAADGGQMAQAMAMQAVEQSRAKSLAKR